MKFRTDIYNSNAFTAALSDFFFFLLFLKQKWDEILMDFHAMDKAHVVKDLEFMSLDSHDGSVNVSVFLQAPLYFRCCKETGHCHELEVFRCGDVFSPHVVLYTENISAIFRFEALERIE